MLLFVLRDADPLAARNLGLTYGLVYGLGTMYWLFALFGPRAIALVGLMAAYFGLLAALVASTRGINPWARAALVAVFAIAVEWLRGDAWYLRFPWYTAPHALTASPAWISLARWLGVYGLSGQIWFLAAAGAFPPPRRLARLVAPARRLAAAVGRAAAGPPGVARPGRGRRGGAGGHPDGPGGRVDLAVLPEYSYTRPAKSVLTSQFGPGPLARRVHCPVVFGAVEGDYLIPPFENVAVVIDADGAVLGTFPKQRPVPLFADGTPGTRRPLFPMDQGVLGVGICYDDEVQSGFGRTGKFFAYQHEEVTPDIVTVAKALSGGFVPVGAMLATGPVFEKVYSSMDRVMVHSATFKGGVLAMTAGLAALQVLDDEGLAENAARTGAALRTALTTMAERFDVLADVRGRGLMIGLEFDQPSSLRARTSWNMLQKARVGLFAQMVVVALFQRHRVLTQVSGDHMEVIKLIPPLMIGDTEVKLFTEAFGEVLEDASKGSGLIWEFGRTLVKQAGCG